MYNEDNNHEREHGHNQEFGHHPHPHFLRYLLMHAAGRRGGPFGGGPFGGSNGPFGGGGPFGGDEPGFGRQRQRRGDIKFILLELLKDEPHHGYELIKALEERSAGFYRPSPGMVYPTLQLLEDEGNLTSTTVDNKRVYTITDAGREVLKARETAQHAEEAEREQFQHGRHGHSPHWDHRGQEEHGGRGERGGRGFGPGGFGGFGGLGADMPQLQALRQSAMALFESVMQTARHGSPEQLKTLQAVLDRTTQNVRATLTNIDSKETKDKSNVI